MMRLLLSALILSVILTVSTSFAQEISNPKLFGKSLEAAMQALEYYGELEDRAELTRVTDIAYRVAMASDFRDFPFSFYLIDMPEPNAFALPGGHIFITRGMLYLGLDDDMLACLLGHEIAHVAHRHGTRMQRRATLLNALGQALVLGVLLGAEDGPENPYDPYGIERSRSRKGSLVQGAAAASLALSELLLRDYSREFEDEADESGQRFAAAAGFDPDGARQLWTLMNARIPQSRAYGYWRTHPFSDQRLRAAGVRAEELKIQQPKPVEDYRAKTQQVLLAFAEDRFPEEPSSFARPDREEGGAESSPGADRRPEDQKDKKSEQRRQMRRFLAQSALTAWPAGPRAEEIRLASLHRDRDRELERPEVERDYGQLVRAYVAELEEVRSLTPETAFLATLESELEKLRQQSEKSFPKATEILAGGIYQTPFLETFLSNYPTAEQAPDVALALGEAYSRLGRQTDAVAQYLRAVDSEPDSDAGRRASAGLRNLTPYLTHLAALQQLSNEGDEALRHLSRKRLSELAGAYDDIANGAEYLQRYPKGEHVEAVRERLETLARNLYGEVVLYQRIGDHVTALDRIQQILTHAPTSEAADRLRDKAVVDS